MTSKSKQIAALIILLFLTGSLIVFLGFSKGRDIASSLSRPMGANMWSVPTEMILGCTYTPVIIGVSLIILSLIFSTVLFIKWFNNSI